MPNLGAASRLGSAVSAIEQLHGGWPTSHSRHRGGIGKKSGSHFASLYRGLPQLTAAFRPQKTEAKVNEAKDSPIYVAITGPNVIPYCGDFELFAHYSWANGVPEAFQWSVTRNDSVKINDKDPLGAEIKSKLAFTLAN